MNNKFLSLIFTIHLLFYKVISLKPNYCTFSEYKFEYVLKNVTTPVHEKETKNEKWNVLKKVNPMNLFKKSVYKNITKPEYVLQKKWQDYIACCRGYKQLNDDCVPDDSSIPKNNSQNLNELTSTTEKITTILDISSSTIINKIINNKNDDAQTTVKINAKSIIPVIDESTIAQTENLIPSTIIFSTLPGIKNSQTLVTNFIPTQTDISYNNVNTETTRIETSSIETTQFSSSINLNNISISVDSPSQTTEQISTKFFESKSLMSTTDLLITKSEDISILQPDSALYITNQPEMSTTQPITTTLKSIIDSLTIQTSEDTSILFLNLSTSSTSVDQISESSQPITSMLTTLILNNISAVTDKSISSSVIDPSNIVSYTESQPSSLLSLIIHSTTHISQTQPTFSLATDDALTPSTVAEAEHITTSDLIENTVSEKTSNFYSSSMLEQDVTLKIVTQPSTKLQESISAAEYITQKDFSKTVNDKDTIIESITYNRNKGNDINENPINKEQDSKSFHNGTNRNKIPTKTPNMQNQIFKMFQQFLEFILGMIDYVDKILLSFLG